MTSWFSHIPARAALACSQTLDHPADMLSRPGVFTDVEAASLLDPMALISKTPANSTTSVDQYGFGMPVERLLGLGGPSRNPWSTFAEQPLHSDNEPVLCMPLDTETLQSDAQQLRGTQIVQAPSASGIPVSRRFLRRPMYESSFMLSSPATDITGQFVQRMGSNTVDINSFVGHVPRPPVIINQPTPPNTPPKSSTRRLRKRRNRRRRRSSPPSPSVPTACNDRVSSEEVEDKGVRCLSEGCEARFCHEKDLKRHLKSKHDDICQWNCGKCGVWFLDLDHAKRHFKACGIDKDALVETFSLKRTGRGCSYCHCFSPDVDDFATHMLTHQNDMLLPESQRYSNLIASLLENPLYGDVQQHLNVSIETDLLPHLMLLSPVWKSLHWTIRKLEYDDRTESIQHLVKNLFTLS